MKINTIYLLLLMAKRKKRKTIQKGLGSERLLPERSFFIDFWRALSILVMIFFHFSFNLDMLGVVDINWKGIFWLSIQHIFIFTFFMASGMSLTLSHYPKLDKTRFLARRKEIAFYAVLITVGSALVDPTRIVYMGALHGILACSFFLIPFLPYPKASLFFGISLLVLYYFFPKIDPFWIPELYSFDYISPFPWFSGCLIGRFFVEIGFHKRFEHFAGFGVKRVTTWFGKRALIIYLVHQVILFPLAYIIRYIIKP